MANISCDNRDCSKNEDGKCSAEEVSMMYDGFYGTICGDDDV